MSAVRSSPLRLSVNLILVPVGRAYRPAVPISQRTELAAAFAQGQARHASGRAADAQEYEQLMDWSADARIAYRLGAAGPEGLQTPAPLAVVVPMLLAEIVGETLARAAQSKRHRVALRLAFVAVAICGQRVGERASVRRARELGLTAETAPLPASTGITMRQAVGLLLLIGIQQVRVRRRVGRWGRVSVSSTVAAAAIRELRLRQDWNAAYQHPGAADSTDPR